MSTDRASHWTYFVEFFAAPPIALSLAVVASMHLPPLVLIVLLLLGVAIWTLFEYWIHRIVLHHIPYFADQHDVHHKRPRDYIGVNSLIIGSAYAAVFSILTIVFNLYISAALIAGILVGYFVYIVIHHRLHHHRHSEYGPWMMSLWKHHRSHHQGGNYDYGVSTTVWDTIFCTRRPLKG